MSCTRFVCIAFWLGCAHPPAPPPPAAPVTSCPAVVSIGETFHLESKVLGERRVINVYLPPGYAEGAQRYPVLYMPDGGIKEDFPHITGAIDVSIKNEVIEPMIVVGIENTERRRDLVAATTVPDEQKVAPHAGGSDNFRRFLREELKPYVAAHYRTSERSAIVGESLAGLFVLETLLVEPTLFDTYIAADPSVWWNKFALVNTAPARFAAWSAPPRRLFMATADAKEMSEGVGILMAVPRPAGLTIQYEPMPAEHHNTIFPIAAMKAFRALFSAADTSARTRPAVPDRSSPAAAPAPSAPAR